MGLKKRGIFFSTDAIIAVSIIFLVLLIAIPISKYPRPSTEIHRDTITSLSSEKIGELNNAYVQGLIADGIINKTNNTILEQIGEFYVTNRTRAKELASLILLNLNLSQNLNIGIWYDNILIASLNKTPIESSSNVETARQLISGIGCQSMDDCNSTTGFSARAFLTNSLKTKYIYFGGYVGDGNITINVDYNGTINSAEMEIVINNDFELFINSISAGTFSKSTNEYTPQIYSIPINNFNSGANSIEFKGDSLHIAGGFLKITYQSDVEYQQPFKYSFPGINGLINIYDGFYVPGNISGLDISLHLNSSFLTFLTIGNITVFRNSTAGEQTIIIPNSTLYQLLNYTELSKKTIPLRLGLENISLINALSNFADVYSVTDISGSMDDDCPGGQADPGEICKINNAKLANKELIDGILQIISNRIGLVGYDDIASNQDFHPLSNNDITLKAKVDEWTAGSGTCICCGINKAINSYNIVSSTGNIVSSRISQSSDDAEECLNNNDIYLTSSDLELIKDTGTCSGGGNQQVGMRFQNITIPQGANIISAYIEFETDETSSENTNLTFSAENKDNAITFTTTDKDITNRQKTTSKVTWSNVPAWSAISGKHNTTDISPVIQEIINRPGWASGNSIAIIVNGTGRRVAESFNGESANAPLLVISYKPNGCGNSTIEGGLGEECDDGNNNNNDACTNSCKNAICGDGVLYNVGGTEQCDDGNINNNDGCSSLCTLEQRYKTMIVMSDGQANQQCSEQATGNAKQDAIQAACQAKQIHNITVYSVSFGATADTATMQSIASCGGGNYYNGDVDEIVLIYQQIAQDIINALYQEQTLNATGNIGTILFPDSYIQFNYEQESTPYGLVLTLEKQFDADFTGTFSIPPGSAILDTKTTSYSGPKWTDTVKINDDFVYQLSKYGQNYIYLGDPFNIYIPNSLINQTNKVNTTLGTSPTNKTSGSQSNKIIYTLSKDISSYSDISPLFEGCNWTIEFEDNTNISLLLSPPTYSGPNLCQYTSLNPNNYNSNDAAQNAVHNLLNIIDLDSNGKIDVKFTSQDLEININELTGIPYVWSTEAQVRIWY